MTDYLDGELNQRVKEALEKHLEECDDCRVLLSRVKKSEKIFNSPGERLSPPAYVWAGIRDKIAEGKRSPAPFIEVIRRSLLRPLPALASAFVLCMIFIGAYFLNAPKENTSTIGAYLSEQINLFGDSQSQEDTDPLYLGSVIEDNFLS